MKEGRRMTLSVLTIALVTAAAFLTLVAATASAAEGPTVMVTSYTVEPEVLMPGDTGTITLTIKNMDTQSSATETQTTVQDQSGTSQQSSTTTTSSVSAKIEAIRLSSSSRDIDWLEEGTARTDYLKLGALGPGQSIPIALPIKAIKSARDGTYFPEVYIEVDNGANVRFPVKVEVDSSEVQLFAQDVPSEISITESTEIVLVVANNRPSVAYGVNVLLKLNTADFDFKPEGVYVGNLGAYEQREVSFTLTPLSLGEKEIEFEATYRNGNNEHSSTLTSLVMVKRDADVKLILVSAPDYVYQGDVATIDFDVANGMTKDIKAVSVVPAVGGITIMPSEYFIGDMEVGDVFSASFTLSTRDWEPGEITIPFKVVFKDVALGKQYETEEYDVNIEIREPQETTWSGKVLAGVLVVILVIVGVVFWMRVKRKRA
jgi:hypothetical protein